MESPYAQYEDEIKKLKQENERLKLAIGWGISPIEQLISLKQDNEELKKALIDLMLQCRYTSNSMGKTGYRLFGSDDFMMVYEKAEELLKEGE